MIRWLTLFRRWYTTKCPPHRGRGVVIRWLERTLAGRVFVASMAEGFRLWLRTDDWVSLEMLFQRVWEAENTGVLKQLLRPGDIFVDVGANLGYFSLLGARRVGPEGTVLAYEPVPATFAWLTSNIRLNRCPNIEASQVALSDLAGTLELHLFPGDSVATASQFQAWRADPGVSVSVPASTLDAHLLPRLGAPVV